MYLVVSLCRRTMNLLMPFSRTLDVTHSHSPSRLFTQSTNATSFIIFNLLLGRLNFAIPPLHSAVDTPSAVTLIQASACL